jgi:transposase
MARSAARDNPRVLPQCPGCRERDLRIAQLETQLVALRADNQKLGERVRRNSSNSSMPPSSNPPDAPKFPKKKPSGRKRGAQPGHPPQPRSLLPPEQVDAVVPLIPPCCEDCQAPLPAEAAADDPPPHRHQIIDLPLKLIHVTEYQGQARTCECGHVTWAAIPADIRAHGIGPRLAAVVSYLTGCQQVGKRGITEILATIFGAPVALGTVSNLEREMSAALESPHAEAARAVRRAPVKNVDETSWKKAGKLCWLWMAATRAVALFIIARGRGLADFVQLMGGKFLGIFISDRWSAYGRLAVQCRQICWAHLRRDFQKCIDRGSKGSQSFGEAALALADRLFHLWHTFRGGGIKRRTLQRRAKPLITELHDWLETGRACANEDKLATFCDNLLQIEPALWTFLFEEGVEPTNNHAERILRKGVLWRKRAFGCQSDNGCRFVERILTVTQTLRLQQRNIFAYLCQALIAHRTGQRAPKLVRKR